MATCVSPIRLVSGDFVPCSKCYACIQRRMSGWIYRLNKELDRSDSAVFMTMTYEDKKVPYSSNALMTLHKEDLQKFWKRLRKEEAKQFKELLKLDRLTDVKDYKKPIKYFAVGEYGSETERPHYHAIIYNADIENLDKNWKDGQTHFGEVNKASIAYTLKYMQKSQDDWLNYGDMDDRTPPFQCMSKGLGENYLTDAMKQWHKKDRLNRYYLPEEEGKKIALPRYYKDKIYNERDKRLIANHLKNELFTKNSNNSIEEVRKNALIAIEKHRRFQANKLKHEKI